MSIKSIIEDLIDAGNEITGEERTDLTAVMQDLKDGYGQGGEFHASVIQCLQGGGNATVTATNELGTVFTVTTDAKGTALVFVNEVGTYTVISSESENEIEILVDDFNKLYTTKFSNLPTGYIPIDYIEADGRQYIDTGYYTSNDLSYEMEQRFTRTDGEQKHGSYYWKQAAFGISQGTFQFALSNTEKNTIAADTNWHVWNILSGTQLIDGTPLASQSILTENDRNVFLFARRGKEVHCHTYAQMRWCKMYLNNVLIRDFEPAIREVDNKVGMYDYVSRTFFTSGSGTDFLAPQTA